MDFNINKYLRREIQEDSNQPEYIIKKILSEYVQNINSKNIQFQKGMIFLKQLSPQEILHIKLHKAYILKKAQDKNIHVRDII